MSTPNKRLSESGVAGSESYEPQNNRLEHPNESSPIKRIPTNQVPASPSSKKCGCPIYCKYCGAKLKKDYVGHYCPTHNCDWQHGVRHCAT